MHANTEQLLALIDGEPVDADARTHALGCADCRAQIEQLQRTRARLRDLPPVDVPPICAAILSASVPVPARRWPAVALATAASVALVFILSMRDVRAPQNEPLASPVAQDRVTDAPEEPNLPQRSAQLEREWRALRMRSGAVQRVGFVAGTSRLKSRLQQLDASYTAADAPQYWDQRIALLDSLVTLERAELLSRPRSDYRVVRTRNTSYPSGDSI